MNNIYIQKAIDYLGNDSFKNINLSFKQHGDELIVKRNGNNVDVTTIGVKL